MCLAFHVLGFQLSNVFCFRGFWFYWCSMCLVFMFLVFRFSMCLVWQCFGFSICPCVRCSMFWFVVWLGTLFHLGSLCLTHVGDGGNIKPIDVCGVRLLFLIVMYLPACSLGVTLWNMNRWIAALAFEIPAVRRTSFCWCLMFKPCLHSTLWLSKC